MSYWLFERFRTCQLRKPKKIYEKLKKDDESILFGKDILNCNLFKKLKDQNIKMTKNFKFDH